MTLPLKNKKQQLVSMAKEAKDDDDNLSASFSWWSDSHNRPHNQSPWLKSIFSDLDDKIKTILNIIQDDGDSFTERAEIFYKRRPELLQILHDLHNSYHSLSQNYDQSPLQISTDVAGLQSDGQDEGYHHMTVSKLIEDNRRQQAELIRRNDEKRLVIKQLRAQVSRLMDDNRALMSRLPLPSYKVDLKRSESTSFSKIKGLNCIGNFHD
ncbi:protein NETWORKED 3C-like [Mercurialis annua]|uniref:protein NETWORKED 3C-like n=1 Tax=Mercurialis annua TaxID=3986 RepID=UPI00215F526D|nr:protein NETWORKED 3C-like [Mercurialis annua]